MATPISSNSGGLVAPLVEPSEQGPVLPSFGAPRFPVGGGGGFAATHGGDQAVVPVVLGRPDFVEAAPTLTGDPRIGLPPASPHRYDGGLSPPFEQPAPRGALVRVAQGVPCGVR